jgi:serine/threonine protein phosphatase PrpC
LLKSPNVILSSGHSDPGIKRSSNQDRILLENSLGLYLLCDGMGGPGHGEIAAELAIRSGHYYVAASRDTFDVSWPFGYDVNRSMDENRLVTAVQLANRQVWKLTEERPEYAGMGTTFVGVIVNEHRASVANVGDSRAYLMRAGELQLITQDDTWVGDLIRSGAISEAQARSHTMQHVLTQAVGAANPVDVHTCEKILQEGDLVLLTSDGVHGVVEQAEIRSILYAMQTLEDTVRKIIDAALRNGGPDNASCVLLQYRSGGGAAK